MRGRAVPIRRPDHQPLDEHASPTAPVDVRQLLDLQRGAGNAAVVRHLEGEQPAGRATLDPPFFSKWQDDVVAPIRSSRDLVGAAAEVDVDNATRPLFINLMVQAAEKTHDAITGAGAAVPETEGAMRARVEHVRDGEDLIETGIGNAIRFEHGPAAKVTDEELEGRATQGMLFAFTLQTELHDAKGKEGAASREAQVLDALWDQTVARPMARVRQDIAGLPQLAQDDFDGRGAIARRSAVELQRMSEVIATTAESYAGSDPLLHARCMQLDVQTRALAEQLASIGKSDLSYTPPSILKQQIEANLENAETALNPSGDPVPAQTEPVSADSPGGDPHVQAIWNETVVAPALQAAIIVEQAHEHTGGKMEPSITGRLAKAREHALRAAENMQRVQPLLAGQSGATNAFATHAERNLVEDLDRLVAPSGTQPGIFETRIRSDQAHQRAQQTTALVSDAPDVAHRPSLDPFAGRTAQERWDQGVTQSFALVSSALDEMQQATTEQQTAELFQLIESALDEAKRTADDMGEEHARHDPAARVTCWQSYLDAEGLEHQMALVKDPDARPTLTFVRDALRDNARNAQHALD